MTYAEQRTIHDADSHVMETPEMLHDFADPAIRERIDPRYFFSAVGNHRKKKTSISHKFVKQNVKRKGLR